MLLTRLLLLRRLQVTPLFPPHIPSAISRLCNPHLSFVIYEYCHAILAGLSGLLPCLSVLSLVYYHVV